MGLHRRTLLRAGSGAALAGLAGGDGRAAAGAGAHPGRLPAGGGTDVMGRVIAEKLRRRGNLKNVVIENRVGASGTLACEALEHAAPDGTTILLAPSAPTVQPVLTFRRLPLNPRTDFAPITLTGTVQTAFVVARGQPVRDFEEYVAWVKADQRRRWSQISAPGTWPLAAAGCRIS